MSKILSLILLYSKLYNLDPLLVLSIVKVESNFNTDAIGELGEVGLLQLRPEYAEVSSKDLLKPEVNIKVGIKHLAEAKKYCTHKENNYWVICYNLGVARGNKIKYPRLHKYYKMVMFEYTKYHQGD